MQQLTVVVFRGTYGTPYADIVGPVPGTFDEIKLADRDYADFRVVAPAPASDSYCVKWPEVLIDGVAFDLPPVEFVWKHGAKIQLINN